MDDFWFLLTTINILVQVNVFLGYFWGMGYTHDQFFWALPDPFPKWINQFRLPLSWNFLMQKIKYINA